MINGQFVMDEQVVQADCYFYKCKEKVSGKFLGWFQVSNVVPASPMIGGTPGGVVAGPVALVRVDTEVYEVRARDITFIKSEFDLELEEKLKQHELNKLRGNSDESSEPK